MLRTAVSFGADQLNINELSATSPPVRIVRDWVTDHRAAKHFSTAHDIGGTILESPTLGPLRFVRQLNAGQSLVVFSNRGLHGHDTSRPFTAFDVFEAVDAQGKRYVVRQLAESRSILERDSSRVESANFRQDVFVRQLMVEAALLAALPSKYFPKVVELVLNPSHHGILAPGPALVLEYLPGPTLRERIKVLTYVNQSIADAIEILRGIEELHRLGFLHGDIKPPNLVMTSTGPKHLDLEGALPFTGSSSRIVGALDHRYRDTYFLVSTPPYRPPNQFSLSDAGSNYDVYSVGIILYEMLGSGLGSRVENLVWRANGCPTNFGLERYGGKMKDLTHQFVYEPVLPRGIDQIIAKAINPTPWLRYQTAQSFREALEAYLPKVAPNTRILSAVLPGVDYSFGE